MRWRYLACLCLGLALPLISWGKSNLQHFDPVSPIVFWVTCIYCLSIVGQFLAKKSSQPAVLGELFMGILFANICYYFRLPEVIVLREGTEIFRILPDILAGQDVLAAVSHHLHNMLDIEKIQHVLTGHGGDDLLKTAYVLDAFSRYGLIYLLFMVGLETSWKELTETGKPAMIVAILGVLAPICLGFISIYLFFPNYSFQTNVFVAATLSATSVGITARVLKDLNKIRTKEARIILGAAMIDDVLGLLVLAVVSSLVLQGYMNYTVILEVLLSSLAFFVISLWFGPKIIRFVVPYTRFLEFWEAKLVVSFVFLMLMSWLASLFQLSSIIGAFTAGLILDDAYFVEKGEKVSNSNSIKHLMAPLQSLLSPLFFFLMGMQVKLETFLSPQLLYLALVLSIVAIIGKLLGGFGAGRKTNRLFIGIGMMPRGEVGLIFASMGKSLGVISEQMFSAIIVMVLITTIIAPPWMKHAIRRQKLLEQDV